MGRTKQTARKSTGGTRPRGKLVVTREAKREGNVDPTKDTPVAAKVQSVATNENGDEGRPAKKLKTPKKLKPDLKCMEELLDVPTPPTVFCFLPADNEPEPQAQVLKTENVADNAVAAILTKPEEQPL